METIEDIKLRVQAECKRLEYERKADYFIMIKCECGETYFKGDGFFQGKASHERCCAIHQDYVRLMKVEIDKLLLPKE